MAYKIEGKDIVISGFENGIADSPYQGISDIRNCDTITVPGEASVAFAPTLTTTQGAISAVTFTASNSGGNLLLTYNGTVPLITNSVITVSNTGGALPTGLVANRAYYVTVVSGTTFNVSSASAGGTLIVFTDAGTGTQKFSTINIGKPKFIVPLSLASGSGFTYAYFMADDNGRVWYYYQNAQWVYMKSLGASGEGTGGGTSGNNGNGLVIYKNYLFLFRQQQIAYIQVSSAYAVRTLAQLTTTGNWNLTWQSLTTPWLTTNQPADVSHYAIVGQTDDTVYFCNTCFVGSLVQIVGKVFDPTDVTTYTLNLSALGIPTNDNSQCIAQLATNLLIGGINNIVFSWDRISIGYSPIFISEYNTVQIVTVNTNAYIFAGQRGRIFITNGAQANLYKKIPDHLSGTVNPYYTWGGAIFNRNQIYFGVQATDNTGTAINQYGGTWVIDLVTDALRLLNQQSYGTYAGITSALATILGTNTSNGFGLLMGWYTSSNTLGGIDKSSSTPYTGGQSYVDSDLIPIGRYIDPQTPSQIEWKTSVPLVSEESVAMYYRLNFNDSYSVIVSDVISYTGIFSEMLKANFQKAQWLQLRAVLTSTASTPSYCRLTEFRIRDFPNK